LYPLKKDFLTFEKWLLSAIKKQGMKAIKLFMLALILTTGNSYGQTQIQSADAIIKEAKKEALKTDRNIFVIFHASWCIWCHRMDTAMNAETIKFLFDNNYIIKHLTVDEIGEKEKLNNPGANELRIKYGGGDQGIPYWFILDKNGKLLADSRLHSAAQLTGSNVGCPAKPEEVEYFIKILKKTSQLTDSQLQLIRARFLKING
jgi:thioredoxin-related protein